MSRPPLGTPAPSFEETDAPAAPVKNWKRRQASGSSNITIRAKDDVIEDFKALCERPDDTPRSYGVMLAKLIKRYQETGGDE